MIILLCVCVILCVMINNDNMYDNVYVCVCNDNKCV